MISNRVQVEENGHVLTINFDKLPAYLSNGPPEGPCDFTCTVTSTQRFGESRLRASTYLKMLGELGGEFYNGPYDHQVVVYGYSRLAVTEKICTALGIFPGRRTSTVLPIRSAEAGGKYLVQKVDGTQADLSAMYFILRLDTDERARNALATYIQNLEDEGAIQQLTQLLEAAQRRADSRDEA